VPGDSDHLRPLDLPLAPEAVLTRWPEREPLAVLWSGGSAGPHARWTVLARPSRSETATPGTAAEAKSFLDRWLCPSSGAMTTSSSLWKGIPDAEVPKFRGGVIVALSYDLGRVLEPAVGASRHRGAPTCFACECADAVIFDHARGRWWALGEPPALAKGPVGEFMINGNPELRVTAAAYAAGVDRVLEYIRAGDVYQVNLAHRTSARFSGSGRAFFVALVKEARPWYGAYVETGEGAVASASPELFLSYDPATRRLTTRPMKGTRPATRAGELETSEKDRAELNMITDLMRNDIGRVSELGSVTVESARNFERHNTLVQTTSTVSGTLRPGLTIADALAATFPGGSVTGCPKIRAMQIIDELEDSPRGFYCGSIGYVSRSGHAAFNIAIRTAVIRGGELTYHAGAGIVIDSDPAAEWQETLDKAGILRRVAHGHA